jgi:hypothetical protein
MKSNIDEREMGFKRLAKTYFPGISSIAIQTDRQTNTTFSIDELILL